tara:strand:- start:914 stop:1318 length:405 start_codon:yes stop_codon:yes gene_type:complete
MNNNYVKSAFRTAISSGNRYVQLESSTTRKEPAHNHPNVRTESAYKDLETNTICVGQENSFRNESGYDFQKNGPTKNNKDAVINQIHKSLVEDSKLSGCDVASRIDLLKIYECIEHELVIKRQSKIPSTAKPLC